MSIRLDSVGAGDGTGPAEGPSITWQHAVSAPDIIIIAIALKKMTATTPSVVSVTVDGNPAQLFRRDNGVGYSMELWTYQGVMSASPMTILATFLQAAQGVGNSVSYAGLNMLGPFDGGAFNSGSSTIPILVITTTAYNCVAVAHCANWDKGFPAISPPAISRWDQSDGMADPNKVSQNGSDSNPITPISPPRAYTFRWGSNNVQWYTQAMALVPLYSGSRGANPGRAGSSIGVRI